MTDFNKKITAIPVVDDLRAMRETIWLNSDVRTASEGLQRVGLTQADAENAQARLQRFAPLLAQAFPETLVSKGIIESDIVPIPQMQAALEKTGYIRSGPSVDSVIPT